MKITEKELDIIIENEVRIKCCAINISHLRKCMTKFHKRTGRI